ncbi:MAG: DUF3035 domain-containing protein [Pseudomonadota bacterium]
MRSSGVAFAALAILLGACANTGLRTLESQGEGPDEFIVSPAKPLEQPESFAVLPVPTPGGANRTDAQPLSDGVAALGGRLDVPTGAIPGSDGGLVNYTRRFGVSEDIRMTLAEEDAEFRRRKARFTQYRIVRVDRYNQAYRSEALDPERTARVFRRAGVPVPSYPPQGR